MNKTYFFLAVLLATASPAGATGVVAGATEWTQILNNIQLVQQYEQQVQQYVKQGQQYQAQLKNMETNAGSGLNPNLTGLVNNIGGIMQAGQAIGGTMAKIDGNFATKFQNPMAGTFSQNFKTWTTTSQDTLGASMRAAGLHRDAYQTDTSALQALVQRTKSSQGDVAAIQTLSEINAMQVQQTQKLGDLLATQNVASNAYMAAQNSKDQAKQDTEDRLWSFKREEPPKPRPANPKNF